MTDPVATGVLTSLNRPGGNITGATFLTGALGAKRLGLLRDLVPGVEVIALLVNPEHRRWAVANARRAGRGARAGAAPSRAQCG
jgi:putative ABC transport system substrate-binding protein